MLAIRSKTFIQGSFWIAAIFVGLAGVLFDEAVQIIQGHQSAFMHKYPLLSALSTPLIFLASVAVVVLIAPAARGSGIPQTLKAMMISVGSYETAMKSGLISTKTAAVKFVSTLLGLLGGASVGREGPTVQISTALFAWIGSKTKRAFPHADFHSYLVAGGAAGVAAAFNTPLAGISFALEEMAEGSFTRIKQTVMVSVIIAGITAQILVGNYTYFGRPELMTTGSKLILPSLLPALFIGIVGGGLGGLFARALAYPLPFFDVKKYAWWKRALLCGVLIALINFFSHGRSAGTGYEITKAFMSGEQALPLWFPLEKAATSILSYLSGMAGGIFSPSLSIGAGVGSSFATLFQVPDIRACGLFGMVAFFTGVVQAPLTAVIIVMEMTEVHEIIFPLMIAAFVAQGTSKLLMPTSLYHHLAFEHAHNKY